MVFLLIILANYSNSTNGTIISGSSSNDYIFSSGNNVTINALAGNDYIDNQGDTVSINAGTDNDTIGSNGAYVSIYGGAGNDSIVLSSGAVFIEYASGDGNDTITGLDSGDTLQITGAEYTTTRSGSNLIVVVGDNSILVQNGANSSFKIDGTLEGSEDELPAGWKFTSTLAAATLTSADDLDLTEEYGADIIRVNASKLTSGVEIIGNDLDNSIKGGKGADTIHGGEGNDTISLGGGADIYVYSGSNDYIRDYTAGADKISLSSGSISGASVSDSNVILNVSTGGNITLKNANGKSITIIDSHGNETSNVYPVEEDLPEGISVNGATLTASSSFTGSEIDLADYSGVTRVDASAVSQTLSIIGTSANNYLSGGKSRDTIYGGAGNDTLTGNDGNDTFVYNSGRDIITDYTAGQDSIQLESGSISNTSYSGNDVIFTIGIGSLTVQNARYQEITITDSNGNTISRTYSNANARTFDLLYDNNFLTDDAALDDITEAKYSVTEIQNTKVEELSQPVLTFAEDK